MNKRNTFNKTKSWKCALVGGLISALPGGIGFGLFLYEGGSRLEGVLMFICLGFGFPALILPHYSSTLIYILSVVVFWFLVGAVISYFLKNNKVAIGIWFLVYAVCLAISIALFAEMMN